MIARIVLVLILVGLLIFSVIRLINAGNDKSTPAKPAKTTSAQQQASAKAKAAQKRAEAIAVAKAARDAVESTNDSAQPPGTAATGSTANPSAPLTNSGPGDVVAIFAGTVIVAALLHRRFVVSRLSAQNN